MRRADLGGPLDQSPPDPTPLVVGMHGGVQDEGVVAAVPGELDEADQPAAVAVQMLARQRSIAGGETGACSPQAASKSAAVSSLGDGWG